MHTYTYIHIHTHTHTYTYTYAYTYIHTYLPYHTIPYHTIPYHTTPHHTIPYHTIPYHTHTYIRTYRTYILFGCKTSLFSDFLIKNGSCTPCTPLLNLILLSPNGKVIALRDLKCTMFDLPKTSRTSFSSAPCSTAGLAATRCWFLNSWTGVMATRKIWDLSRWFDWLIFPMGDPWRYGGIDYFFLGIPGSSSQTQDLGYGCRYPLVIANIFWTGEISIFWER